MNPDLTVKAAGGYILQLLPGAGEEDIEAVERATREMPPVTSFLSDGHTAADLALKAMAGMDPELLDEREVVYHCGCTRQRVEKALVSVGPQELTAMAEEDGKAEVCCHFCNKKYRFSKEELLAMAGREKPSPKEE